MTGTGGDSSDPDRPTHVLRPRAVRVAGYFTGFTVLVGMVIGAVVMPGFTLFGRACLVMVGLLILVFCHLEASVRLVARPRTLVVHNLFRHRTLEWTQIVGVSFPMGDPWAHLNLADGSTLATMAIQRYDGKRGIDTAHRLAALVRERGEPDVGDITGEG